MAPSGSLLCRSYTIDRIIFELEGNVSFKIQKICQMLIPGKINWFGNSNMFAWFNVVGTMVQVLHTGFILQNSCSDYMTMTYQIYWHYECIFLKKKFRRGYRVFLLGSLFIILVVFFFRFYYFYCYYLIFELFFFYILWVFIYSNMLMI